MMEKGPTALAMMTLQSMESDLQQIHTSLVAKLKSKGGTQEVGNVKWMKVPSECTPIKLTGPDVVKKIVWEDERVEESGEFFLS